MRHPLEVKLRRYRAWTQVYAALTASGHLLAIYAIVLFLLGTIDWYLRPTSFNARVFLWLLAFSPLLSIPVLLYKAFRRRRSNVELARGLEDALPSLRNWLAGAIDFLRIKKEEPSAGSRELRDAVIDRATELSAKVDFSKTLNRRPVYRSIATMLFVIGLVAIIIILQPTTAFTALRRLTQPLSPIAWPRKTMLVVKTMPARLARGSAFQAVVADEHGRTLPEQAKIYYRFEQEKVASDKSPARPVIEAETIRTDRHQIVLFRDRADRSFSFRVTAGDDHRMPWQTVTVVDPPVIESLKMEVIPPSYIEDRLPTTVPITDRTCLREGSQVRFMASVSKPVRQATLLLGEAEYEGQIDPHSKGRRILFPAKASGETITLDESCSLAFEVEDQYGLEVTIDRSQKIELIENRPPTVTLLHPANDERVVARAFLPIEASIEDDLAARSVVLHWTIESAASGTRASSMPIYQGPAKLRLIPKKPQKVGACPPKQEKLAINYPWDLAPLKLAVDDRIHLYLVATDYSGLHTASEPIEVTIVDPASFINQLASDQRAITDEMAQALAIGKQNHRRMIQVRTQIKKDGQIHATSLDLLRAVMLDRRQVVRTLTDENDGLIARASSILKQLDSSRLRAGALRNRLLRLLENLETLRSSVLPVIEQNVTSATKNAELVLDTQSGVRVEMSEITIPLSTAIRQQQRLIAKLEAMLGRLDDLVDYQRFYDDLKRLVRSQRTLTEQTKKLGRALLGRVMSDIEPSERKQLEQASRDQDRLARESTQAIARMVQAAERAVDVGDLRIALAVKSPAARSLGATLARASEAISQNQLGRAVKLQLESITELEAMLEKMTQTSGPADEDAASGAQVTLETDRHRPGEKTEEVPRPGPAQKETGTKEPGQQTNEVSTFAPGQPSEAPTHLKSNAVDDLIERLWGELPDREREKLIQLPGERFLPGYERQIESYYRRLLDR